MKLEIDLKTRNLIKAQFYKSATEIRSQLTYRYHYSDLRKKTIARVKIKYVCNIKKAIKIIQKYPDIIYEIHGSNIWLRPNLLLYKIKNYLDN